MKWYSWVAIMLVITTLIALSNTGQVGKQPLELSETHGLGDSLQDYIEEEHMTLDDFERTRVQCGSDSMGLIMGCNDVLLLEEYDPETTPRLGKMYVFEDEEEEWIVHRLVACMSPSCNTVIFKGDANEYADKPVHRKNIKYEVRGVVYTNSN